MTLVTDHYMKIEAKGISKAFGSIQALSDVSITMEPDVIREQAGKGLPILFSSHQLELVDQVSTEVAIISLGKIIGMAVVGLTQIAIIIAAAYAAARGFGLMGDIFADVNLGSAIWLALGFFLVGYLSYATLYAAFAATVSRAEEVNAAVAPVMYVLLIPYLAVVIPVFSGIAPLRYVLDYVPLFSPIGATVHYFQGGLELWQALLSLAISLVALPIIMLLASRIYRRSVLVTGARLKILSVLRG